MTNKPGLLELDRLRELVQQGEVETVVVGFTDHYGRLLGKRYDAEMFVDEIAKGGAHACDYLLTVDMEMNPVPGYRYASWEQGYGDFHMAPDLSTLRTASWLDRTAQSGGTAQVHVALFNGSAWIPLGPSGAVSASSRMNMLRTILK